MSDEKKVIGLGPVENRHNATNNGGDTIPDGNDYIERLMEIVSKSLAAKEAYEYVNCRRNGGSMEECMGIFRAAPIPLPKPDIPAKEAIIVLKSVREILLKRVELLDKEIKKMNP